MRKYSFQTLKTTDAMPELCKEMTEKALAWREKIESTWDEKFAMNYKNLT